MSVDCAVIDGAIEDSRISDKNTESTSNMIGVSHPPATIKDFRPAWHEFTESQWNMTSAIVFFESAIVPLDYISPNPTHELPIGELPGESRFVEMVIDWFASEEHTSLIVREACPDTFVPYCKERELQFLGRFGIAERRVCMSTFLHDAGQERLAESIAASYGLKDEQSTSSLRQAMQFFLQLTLSLPSDGSSVAYVLLRLTENRRAGGDSQSFDLVR